MHLQVHLRKKKSLQKSDRQTHSPRAAIEDVKNTRAGNQEIFA